MAVAFPRDLRTSGIRLQRVTFSPLRSVATAKLPAGLQAMETGPAIWRAAIACRGEHEYGRRRNAAFVASLVGTGSFLCYSPSACWPAKHPGGQIAGAWTDTLSVTAVTPTTIMAVAPNGNLRISAGDYVGLEQLVGGVVRYGYFQVLVDALPVASALGLDVFPRVPSFFTSAATLRLHQPVCEMVLDPGAEPDMGDGLTMAPVSWQAIQKVA